MSSAIRKDLTVEENARWLLKGFGRGRLMADSMVIFRGTTVSSKSSLRRISWTICVIVALLLPFSSIIRA